MSNLSRLSPRTIVALLLLIPGLLVAAMVPSPVDPESPAYSEGREALDDRDWKAAEDAFRRAIQEDPNPDAAHYWLAYAQAKRGRTADALATLGKLERDWPRSAWRDDAEALRVELRRAGGHVPEEDEIDDDELKLMALAGLAHSDPERALPIVEKILRGDGSDDLKEQALFVAGQMGGSAGFELLVRAAKDGSNDELQESAIEYIAILGGERSLPVLDELFNSGVGVEAQEAILGAYMMAGAKDRLLAAARSDADPELRAEAAQLLGTQGAVDELWQLYQTESHLEVKEAVLEGLMISGNSEHLRTIAVDPSEPELQEEAIQLLGVMGDHGYLLEIFQQVQNAELKEEIVQALGIAGRVADLETIARDRSQPLDVRSEAVMALGIHGGGDRLWGLLQEGEVELSEDILEGLALAGQGDRLLSLVRDTSISVEVREQAIEGLVIVGLEVAELRELYRSLKERKLREGILEVMFISGAAEALAEVVRTETDRGLRAEAVEFLGLTGSPLAAEVLEEILEER